MRGFEWLGWDQAPGFKLLAGDTERFARSLERWVAAMPFVRGWGTIDVRVP